jgi:hypothetical protein
MKEKESNRYLCNGWQAGNFLHHCTANAVKAALDRLWELRYEKLPRYEKQRCVTLRLVRLPRCERKRTRETLNQTPP